MSHFSVLTAVDIPDDFVWPALTDEQEQMLHALKDLNPGEENRFAIFVVQQLMIERLHPVERMVESLISPRLEPYCECTEDPRYLEFENAEDEYRESYETGTEDFVRLANGTICPVDDYRFSRLYEVHDGLIYKKRYGQLRHRKRTKRAKAMTLLKNQPYARRYKTLAEYLEFLGYPYNEKYGAYGYMTNPNAKWDWFQIGGRFPYAFLVKEDCTETVHGDYSFMLEPTDDDGAPSGYKWVTGARKRDIEWEQMRRLRLQAAEQRYNRYRDWFITGIEPQHKSFFAVRTEEGILGWSEKLYVKDETLEEYMLRTGINPEIKYPYETYAVVTDEEWIGSGDMGWWGLSSNEMDKPTWYQALDKYIDSLPDTHLLVSIDCHI